MLTCKYCNKVGKNSNSYRNHERLCPHNPDRKYVSHTLGRSPWNKGLTKADPRVAKNAENLSKALKGKPSNMIWTEERRKAKSEWRKQYHKDHPEAHPNRRLAGNRNKMSYPERVAYDYLTKHGILFEHNKKISKYFPDFVIGTTIIEIDGEHWHDAEYDKIRDAELNALGYAVYRINTKQHIETEIKKILRFV